MADLDLLDDERRAKLLERTATAKPLTAEGLWRRALNGIAISAGTLRRIVLLEEEIARLRAESAEAQRIGRQAAVEAIVEHAHRRPPGDTMRRHLMVAVQVASEPATPAQIAAAIATLARPVVAVACHLDDAGRSIDPSGGR